MQKPEPIDAEFTVVSGPLPVERQPHRPGKLVKSWPKLIFALLGLGVIGLRL